MDMEEVYLRQITEHLKKLNELQETNNDLLDKLLQKLSNQIKDTMQILSQNTQLKGLKILQTNFVCLKVLVQEATWLRLLCKLTKMQIRVKMIVLRLLL